MPDDDETLVRQLSGGQHRAADEIQQRAVADNNPILLVAAALLADEPDDLLRRAAKSAVTARDRQLVVIGPVDSLLPSLLGGLLTGAVLGALQAWAFGRSRPSAVRWIIATALGLMVGLGVGAAVVSYQTTLSALLVQGAVTGFVVGAAQAVVLAPRLGRAAMAWPAALTVIWAVGWAVTYAFGIQVDEQFTVFGSSGAVVVTALTAALPLILTNRKQSRS
jgi:hypothetical protein